MAAPSSSDPREHASSGRSAAVSLDRASLAPRPRRTGRRRWLAALVLVAVPAVVYFGVPHLTPLPASLDHPPEPGIEITDRNGRSLRKLLNDDRRVEAPLTFDDLPPEFIGAIISAEDQRFWSHGGIDFAGMVRAALHSAEAGRLVSGASTITQQLVKVSRGRYHERTWRDKVFEMFAARKIEMRWSKKRILTEYLSRVEFGNQFVGCAAAAEGYFRKPLADLSLAESALLAGLPQAPSRLNPWRNPEAARRRQQWVLERMREDGRISVAEEKRAAAERLSIRRWTGAFEAPHFVDMLVTSPRWPELEAASARVQTTLDLELQRACERAVESTLTRLADHNVRNAAVVVIDNQSGSVRALVGSQDYFADDDGQINGAFAARSAGSTLKPFTYLLALQQGASPATVVDDLPLEFATSTGVYRPENYDRRSHGPVSIRQGLANSLNLAAVRILEKSGGAAALHSALCDAGLTTLTESPEHYGLGLTLGNAEVQLIELANAFACLARLGEWRPLEIIETGDVPGSDEARLVRRCFDRTACWLIADILSDNQARARGFGLNSPLRLPFPVAAKTGTSTDFRDNWCVGFTPEFTVGVWIGNFDRRPMTRVSGVTGAAPLWREIFSWIARRHPLTWYPWDPSVIEVEVDPLTGERVPERWQRHRAASLDKFRRDLAPGPAPQSRYDDLGRVILPRDYASWLRGPENWLGNQAIADHRSSSASGNTTLKIVSPVPGATFFLDPDLPGTGRRLRLRATALPGTIAWASETLKIEQHGSGAFVRLAEGRHRIVAQDSRTGETSEAWVVVKQL